MEKSREAAGLLDRVSSLVLIATCLFVVFVAYRVLRVERGAVPLPKETNLVGTASKVTGVKWNANNSTLLLAISTKCHFCEDSVPFYKNLSSVVRGRHVGLVAVFPQNLDDAQRYVDEHGLQVTSVQHEDFSNLGVSGTPTIFLVDTQGMVMNEWVGRLGPEREKEVINALQRK